MHTSTNTGTIWRTHAVVASTSERPVHRGAPASQYRRGGRPSVVRRPNYVVRRCVAVVLAVGIVLVMAVLVNGLLASFGGRTASAAEARPAGAPVSEAVTQSSHVARPGDTMWSIASQYRGDVAHGSYVDELIRVNGGTVIVVGQAVILP
jgi:hypothetical protein